MPEGELAFGDVNELAAEIRTALGIGPYEKVKAMAPQFDREDGRTIPWYPKSAEELDRIKTLSHGALHFLGLQEWVKGHWLFPAEWYEHIPDGYEIVDISDKTECFKQGVTDKDRRYGCLAYGFKRRKA